MALERKKEKLTDAQLKRKQQEADRIVEATLLRAKDVEKVLSLNMHESVWCQSIYRDVLRVYDGWIYSTYNSETDTMSNTVFVPDTRD